MSVRKTIRHNADGSKTRRTTYSRKTLFGNTKSHTYVQRIPAKKKKGCYVATAIYGSYDCPQVWVLRRYRDEALASTLQGRTFINVYYTLSPMFVRLFGNTRFFNRFVRAKLDSFVDRLIREGYVDTPYQD